jgi:hypothetical protein
MTVTTGRVFVGT